MIFSIDQNCHSLWDALPKLEALARRGLAVRHFIEDVDVAFTAVGADAGAPADHPANRLRLVLERYHRGGGADWGAALFYSEFLGRLPVELCDLEPRIGMKVKALARQFGRSVDDLYDELSPGDNWQLIGSSYVDGEHHRVIGDIRVAEAAEFLREMMAKAQADMIERFPGAESARRVNEWFQRESAWLEDLLSRHSAGRLVDVYRDWLAKYADSLPGVDVALTSGLFGLDDGLPALLEPFIARYDAAAGLYNEAIQETASPLHRLDAAKGELPFFAVLNRRGHLVRTEVFLDDGKVRIAGADGLAFLLGADGRPRAEELKAAGVVALAGKALLLPIQVRLPGGGPLALPYRGSVYMPSSMRLARKLGEAGMLPGKLHPVLRVRFHLLDRLSSLQTPIRLPEHLAECLGREEIPACALAESYPEAAREAAERLESFRDDEARLQWQRRSFPGFFDEIDSMDAARRELARKDPKGPRIREISKRIKERQQAILAETLSCVWRDWQVSQVDYWDSRGAIRPWCIALGGEEFYNQVLAGADVYEET